MKVVIDTNGLLSSIPSGGKNKWLYHAFIRGDFTWAISNEILSEYDELISFVYGKRTADFVLNSILSSRHILRYEPDFKWQLIAADPDDNKFVDCTIGANADFLVSDDKHLLNLLKRPQLFPPVPVISFQKFRKIIT